MSRAIEEARALLQEHGRDELGCGLRFAVSDEHHNHLYSFALDHQLLLTALALAYPEGGGPPAGK